MKYLRGVKKVALNIDKSKLPQCDICGEGSVYLNYTEDKKLVCRACMSTDADFEWVNWRRVDDNVRRM